MLPEFLGVAELLAYAGLGAAELASDVTGRSAFSDGGEAFYRTMYGAMSAVIEKTPSNAQAWFLRGIAAQGNQWHEEALANLTEAIRLDPQHAKAYLVRSEVLASLGRYDMARADRADALAIDPKVVQ